MQDRIESLIEQLTLEEKVALTTGQDFWTTMPVDRLGIDSIWLGDGPHGLRKAHSGSDSGLGGSLEATCFPTASALASSWNTALVEEIGRALGRECRAQGIQVLLGPGLNIKRSPLCGRNFEYYSEDPLLAGEMACAFVRGVQDEGVGTSVKHYACNNQETGRMTISAEVDERTLREIYLAAFEKVIKRERPWTVMASYNRVNGVAVTENRYLLTDILRDEWGFGGLVVSDWSAVNYRHVALAAGLDLEMPGAGDAGNEKVLRAIRDGELPEEILDRAVRRVLMMALQGAANRQEGYQYNSEAHHLLARNAAAQCMVLLKNDGDFLPLDFDKLGSLAVIGRFARDPRYQGAGSSLVNPARLDNAFEEIAALAGGRVRLSYADGYPEGDTLDEELIRDAVSAAQGAEAAVIFAGLPPDYESEGFDRSHMEMPPSHNRLIEAVCRAQPDTVVVLSNGSAVTMPWLDGPRAVLEGWLGGQASGGAAADLLCGLVNPSGKLAETLPARLEDTPAYLNFPGEEGRVRYGEGLFVGYRYYERKKIEPLFPFGFGLSYTSFSYSELSLGCSEISDSDRLTVACRVTNSGPQSGSEVVQLYLRDEESRLIRPEKELKGFAKISLEPGESKAVEFTLEGRDFAYYDSSRKNWVVESGIFQVLIGASSADIKLTGKVQMNSKQQLEMHYHKMLPLRDFLADQTAREIMERELEGTPLGMLIEAADDNESFMVRMVIEMPLLKLLGFTAGTLTEKKLDEIMEQINRTVNG